MAAKTIVLQAPARRVDWKQGSVFFIGNATTIIRYAGFTILTDPNFLHRGDHARLGYGLRSERLTDPAIDIDALPPLDLVLLSHMHDDHFDHIAAERLDRTIPIITTRHARRALKQRGFKEARALKTWQSLVVQKGETLLRITSMPGTHVPRPLARLLPPVMGSLLEWETPAGRNLLRMYISGDTLVHNRLKEIPKRHPDIDLALLHLGGTRVLGLMVTMDARQGVEALRIIAPTIAIPIHYNDYSVFTSSLEDFKQEVHKAGLEDHIRYLAHGETYRFRVPGSRAVTSDA